MPLTEKELADKFFKLKKESALIADKIHQMGLAETRTKYAQEVYANALRDKWLSGLELTKDEAIIKFMFDMQAEDEEKENG